MKKKFVKKKFVKKKVLVTIAILFSVTGCSFLVLSSCSKTYFSIDDYHMIYDNVENCNKNFSFVPAKKTLLYFGEYGYNSYLLFFPRKAPEGLQEFYFYWLQAMDYDVYLIYASYKLNVDDYNDYKKNISNFSLTYHGATNKPIYDETNFAYPTYIALWSFEEDYLARYEYVMLDDAHMSIVCVYMFDCDFPKIESHSNYTITPKCDLDSVIQGKDNARDGFSMYTFSNYTFSDTTLGAPPLSSITFDDFVN